MNINSKPGEIPSLLIVIPWSPSLPGGVSVVVRNLVKIWREASIPTVVAVSDWQSRRPSRDREGNINFRFALVGALNIYGLLKGLVNGPITLFRTHALLTNNSVNCVQFHYPSLNALGMALLKTMKLYRGSISLCFHGTDVRPPKTYVARMMWQIIFSATNTVNACSRSLAQQIATEFRIDLNRVTIAYNGVDAEIFSARARLDSVESSEVFEQFIVNVGSYTSIKGQRYLIEALAQIKDEFPVLGLIVIGHNGDELPLLLARIKSLGLASRVKLLVDLEPAKVASILARAQICVQPSLMEGFGLAVIEAGACGVPVAVSGVGGHVELIDDGTTGLLFPPKNASSIAEAVRRLLVDVELRKRMAVNWHEHVLDRFTWKHCGETYLSNCNIQNALERVDWKT